MLSICISFMKPPEHRCSVRLDCNARPLCCQLQIERKRYKNEYAFVFACRGWAALFSLSSAGVLIKIMRIVIEAGTA
jgi:hypothetical protein